MARNDQEYFESLKKKVAAMMQQAYPGINPSISEWKGQEITDFQEELLKKVGANISEKWFYTHMKSGQSTLPRIDVLNFLSRYAGYSNWDDFVFRQKESVHAEPKKSNHERYFIIVPVLTITLVAVFYGLFLLFNTQEYKFCFFDADTREPITSGPVEVRLLLENESPVTVFCGPGGCFSLKTDKSRIRMVVSSPYYRTDTLVRILKKLNRNEVFTLHANNYALMIHFISNTRVADWENRRKRLEQMLDDGAMIYQVYGDRGTAGMDLYNKSEFIDRLTMPTGNLKNIEVLDTKFRQEKISMLKFRVKTTEK